MSSEEKISPDEFDQELEALMSGKKTKKEKRWKEKEDRRFGSRSSWSLGSQPERSSAAEKTWSRWWTP